ncbi:NFACT RNA binding domain-containing protein [Nanoarchaeota archaeon]
MSKNMRIALDIRKSLEQNAAHYFDKSKKAKKKMKGAQEAIEKTKAKMGKVELIKEEKKELKQQKKLEWYEKYHWFVSSDGFLVIGGRDATTNEIIIKKHSQEHDKVFHTDMAGSPFVVVKSEGKEIPEQTLDEAAAFTLAYSRAWKQGMATAPVFYVNPDQVSKKAKSGEYLGKGSFMIYGETKYMDTEMSFAVGIYNGKAMGGPFSAIQKNCPEIIEIIQGRDKKSDAAKKIKYKLGGDLDEIISALPAGGVALK